MPPRCFVISPWSGQLMQSQPVLMPFWCSNVKFISTYEKAQKLFNFSKKVSKNMLKLCFMVFQLMFFLVGYLSLFLSFFNDFCLFLYFFCRVKIAIFLLWIEVFKNLIPVLYCKYYGHLSKVSFSWALNLWYISKFQNRLNGKQKQVFLWANSINCCFSKISFFVVSSLTIFVCFVFGITCPTQKGHCRC